MRLTKFVLLPLVGLALVSLAWAQERTIGRVKDGQEGPRVALVIGNAAYQTAALRNPVNDARAMAEALKKLGFQVDQGENLDRDQMKKAIWRFGERLKPHGVNLFFYAGHGFQVGGLNYLVPLGARIMSERDAELEAIDVRYVLSELDRSKGRVNLVILDACRDNPFSRGLRSSAQGLASMDAPTGTLIAFATGPGRVAADGAGGHGLYTEALLQHIQRAGLRVEEVFKQVRAVVAEKSEGKQIPWESSSLMGEFSFQAGQGGPVPPGAVDPGLAEERRRLEEERARLEAERRQLEEARRLAEERRKVAQEMATLAEEKQRTDQSPGPPPPPQVKPASGDPGLLDLRRWEVLDGRWESRDGALWGSGGHIILKQQLTSYVQRITVEMLPGPGGAAGLGIRAGVIGGGQKRFRDRTSDIQGYTCNFSPGRTYNLFKGIGGAWYLLKDWKGWPTSEALNPRLNSFELTVDGDMVQIKVNDRPLASFADGQFRTGSPFLWVQEANQVVKFSQISIAPLAEAVRTKK